MHPGPHHFKFTFSTTKFEIVTKHFDDILGSLWVLPQRPVFDSKNLATGADATAAHAPCAWAAIGKFALVSWFKSGLHCVYLLVFRLFPLVHPTRRQDPRLDRGFHERYRDDVCKSGGKLTGEARIA